MEGVDLTALFGWLKTDPLIVVCAALAWAYWRKDQQIAAAQESRIKMTQEAVEVVERQTATYEKLVSTVAALTDEIRRGQ